MFEHIRDALCVVMGSQTHQMTLMAASIGSALLYGMTSTSMAFINKVVLDVYNFNFPMTIMTTQMVVTFTILKVLNLLNCIKLMPLTRNNLKQFIGPTIFYSLNGVLSLAALGQMNLTMYSVVKRNGPLVTMVLSTIILKKSIPGKRVVTGVLMMSVGCIIAAEGDITFELEAYIYGVGSVLSQSLYLILLQKLSDNFSTPDTLYMNSILSFPVLALMTALFGEYHRVYQFGGFKDAGFIVMLILVLVMGSFLNFTLFLCNSNNSALTTSIVGTLKSVAQTTMGMFTFGGVTINPAMLTGVTMNLTGGIFYTYAKYLEGEKAKEMKKHQSEINLDEMERGDSHNEEEHKTSENVTHLNHKTGNSKEPDERIL